MEPKSRTSKDCFIDTVRLGYPCRCAVENTWGLWQLQLGTVVTATVGGYKKP